MSGKTKIEWADKVWNPVTGCTKVSEGCRNCYAESMAKRFWKDRPFSEVRLHPERLEEIHHWRKPARVFVNSMSDLFHPDVPFDFVSAVFNHMEIAINLTFMVLTKRPERMNEFTREYGVEPHKNIWLGVSAEDQMTADARIPWLLKTPAGVRFVSIEPMLGPVDLEPYLQYPPLHDHYKMTWGLYEWSGLDWVICGGESGLGARPMAPNWPRSLRDQCQEADVPFFFKQWGDVFKKIIKFGGHDLTKDIDENKLNRELDGREWNEFPEVNHDG